MCEYHHEDILKNTIKRKDAKSQRRKGKKQEKDKNIKFNIIFIYMLFDVSLE